MGKKIGKYEVLNVSRTELIYKFLKSAKWDGATIKTLAGDASFRRYDRIFLNNKSAILMDAPPDFEDTRPFAAIARHLVLCDLCAPRPTTTSLIRVTFPSFEFRSSSSPSPITRAGPG